MVTKFIIWGSIKEENMDTSRVISSGILKKGEEIIEYTEGSWKIKSNVTTGFLLITNKRFMFLKKPGIFAKGLSVIYQCSLGDILSVSPGGLFGKRLDINIEENGEIKTLIFSCSNPQIVNQKLNGAKENFVEEQTIDAKRVIIEEGNKDNAMEILKKKLARGEITLEEFHQKVQRL